MVLDVIAVFIAGLLLGALGIYVGAWIVTDTKDYKYAILTAFLGALVWAVVSFFFYWIPLLGPILTLIAWIWVINRRYPGGWLNALLIGFSAWVTVLLALSVLTTLDITTLEAIGVPT